MKLYKLLIIMTGFLCTSCLENISDPPLEPSSTSAKAITYIENYYNVLFDPNFQIKIDVDSLYKNNENFLIIDIRSKSDFNLGHIPNAVNYSSGEIVEVIESNYSDPGTEVVLISKNGQDAAYITALLRLLGYSHVYFLEYGMSIWNEDFADDWEKISSNFNRVGSFESTPTRSEKLFPLPNIIKTHDDIPDLIRTRIINLINLGYSSVERKLDDFYGSYNGRELTGVQILCFGPNSLYGSFELGHPPGTLQLLPPDDLKAINKLQYIRPDVPVAIYDWNGHTSAMATAYLKIIGYNVHNLHFGAYAIIYEDFRLSAYKRLFILTRDKIRNYPYVVE